MNDLSYMDFEQLKDEAVENSKVKNIALSLKLYEEMRRRRPDYAPAYVNAAYICLNHRKFKDGDSICLEGFEKLSPPNLSLYLCYAEIKTAQLKYADALERWAEVRKVFPKAAEGYKRAAFIYRQMAQYENAERICQEGIAKTDKKLGLYQYYAILAREGNRPEIDKLKEIFRRRQEICRVFPDNIEEMTKLANTCIRLAKYEPLYFFLYNDLVATMMRRYAGDKSDNANKGARKETRPKVCFFGLGIRSLGNYYRPVIKFINPCLVDLVFKNNTLKDQELIEHYGFEKYKIFYGDEQLLNYDYIVCADLTYPYMDADVKEKIKSRLIILHHGIECSVEDYFASKCVLLINEIPSELDSEIVLNIADLDDFNKESCRNLEVAAKCEVAHTGMYHIDKFMPNPDDRQYYKNLMKEKLGHPIDDDKPTILLQEDLFSHFGQIVYCLNKLCDVANVILMPYFYYERAPFKRLNPKIKVFMRNEMAWYDLRYAVDFILAGYRAGTFTSSLFLGLNVIPYYSRIETNLRNIGPYIDHFQFVRENDPNWAVNRRICKYLKPFDLLKPNEIKKAITGNEYKEWYQKILPELRREAFGDYARPEGGGAARLAAEYIMRFACKGTLGKDCDAIYLKNEYFK